MILFQGPQRLLFVGPSGSGKSHLMLKLIENRGALFDDPFEEIIYVNPLLADDLYQESYFNELKNIFPSVKLEPEFHPGLYQNWVVDARKHQLLILDDCLDTVKMEDLTALVTKLSRHRKISFWMSSQNPFYGKGFVTIFRNLTGMFVFDTYDLTMLRTLSSRLTGGKGTVLKKYLESAGNFMRYPYLYLNFQPCQDLTKISRIWTRILPFDELELKNVIRPICFKE